MEARGEDEAPERLRLEGGNMGASMSVSHGGECKLPNCCCINIYVNSNIQGVNNSTLNGGEVKMGSPGVFFLFGVLLEVFECPPFNLIVLF
ncbi:xyloglucan galactosyltransferase KATAMARI1-like protein [Cucumis melo var. makuwa]|uniref:Xyloglucan galactosyltransferase KATAMARI1-like protein n=1 Tax=Cucumis melo var. makuwa TaxID=1194695 RepID=A0A5A7T8V9_CUCMM|nr:xyloglucan galactosyltransferase KATAMARI1-like protein [Cucumis melo var. makuwa]TYK24608.1 xyloglucan galactosyltransferase KATAMARI1-like protein [Cucumis melo var. makuwa]